MQGQYNPSLGLIPSTGRVPLKKYIVHSEDDMQVESDIIASRLHEVLIRFGSVHMPDDRQTLENGTLPAHSRARQKHAMESGGTVSESREPYRRWTAMFGNFCEFHLPKDHPESASARGERRAGDEPHLLQGEGAHRCGRFHAFQDAHDRALG